MTETLTADPTAAATTEPKLVFSPSRGFPAWLASTGGSLALTTYQAGKILFIGTKADGKLSFFERTFPRAMALGVSDDAQSLLLSTEYQLYRFDNLLPPGQSQDQYDALYAPHATWITGDLDIHGLMFGEDERPIFINTLFNCLATVSDSYSFRPLWRPPFISRLAAEDRCHLNGMAVQDGRPRFVTCVSRSDIVDGWRDRRVDGGVVIDVDSCEIVAEGLSMPHSPKLHDGRLWLINSGTGEFGWIENGAFKPLCFCPGYARGLTIIGGKAVIGLSRTRETRTFQDLPLDNALRAHDVEARCGLIVVDLVTGDTTDWLRIEGVITEVFDVVSLPGIKCPSAIGLRGSEVSRMISIEEDRSPGQPQ